MMIHEITEQVGAKRRRKRVGRGEASGVGKTSGRGHKGARSRSGWSYNANYEGGQIPFARRIPKRGFNNVNFAQHFHVVNLKSLEARCDDGATVDVEVLARIGLVRDASRPLKVLGEGDLKKRLTVTAAKFSASAKSKIEAAGGSAVERPIVRWTRAAAEAKKTNSSGTEASAG
jgi:large subunit ribosomal protein L15